MEIREIISYHKAADCLFINFSKAFIFTHKPLKITKWLKSVEKTVFCPHGQPPTCSIEIDCLFDHISSS